jgi:hypothetical protein
MHEQKFKGLWTCPDYQNPINDAPPYKYKCDGMMIEDAAATAFADECRRIIQLNN